MGVFMNNNLKEEVNRQEQEINDRIGRLYGEQKGTIVTRGRKLTEEERKTAIKNIVITMWIVGIFMLVMIVWAFLPINKSTSNEPMINEPVVNNALPDGDLLITNETVIKINNSFNFESVNPLYENNILKLFNDTPKTIETLDFQTQMLLITSNEKFKTLMNNKKIEEYTTNNIILTVNELQEVATSIFGYDIGMKYEDFQYYIKVNEEVIYFDAKLENNQYKFIKAEGKGSSFYVYSVLSSAHKIDTNVYIQNKVFFIKNNKIYSDKEMTQLVSDNITEINNVLDKANKVQYLYNIRTGGTIEYLLNSVGMY